MPNPRDEILSATLARKQSLDLAKREALEAEARRVSEENSKRQEAKTTWDDKCFPMISAVVTDINEKIREHGLEIRTTGADKPHSPAISQIEFILYIDGVNSRKHVRLNVNAYGKIQFYASIENRSKTNEDDVRTLSEDKFRDIVVEFLDMCI